MNLINYITSLSRKRNEKEIASVEATLIMLGKWKKLHNLRVKPYLARASDYWVNDEYELHIQSTLGKVVYYLSEGGDHWHGPNGEILKPLKLNKQQLLEILPTL